MKVLFSEDPAQVLAEAGEFLASEPVLHNLILSLLIPRDPREGSDVRIALPFCPSCSVCSTVADPTTRASSELVAQRNSLPWGRRVWKCRPRSTPRRDRL